MEYNLNREVKLFMIFDILGDTVRSGPVLWHIKRDRLEDVKNHIMDLLLIVRLLRQYLPDDLDYDKIYDYIILHDLPEAITGDITKFEGVSGEEIKRVTDIAINYLSEKFGDLINIKKLLPEYESRLDLESKVVNMIDRVHSSTTFIKYQTEQDIDMNNPVILPELRNHPFVVKKIKEGKDLADIFFEFHMMSVTFSEEECQKYNINRVEAERIVNVIRAFAIELYNQKLSGSLLDEKKDFPLEAMIYNRNK